MELLLLLPLALLIFVGVILIRTLRFLPKKGPALQENACEFDQKITVERLQALVRCKTVSYADHSLEDDAEFEKVVKEFEAITSEEE